MCCDVLEQITHCTDLILRTETLVRINKEQIITRATNQRIITKTTSQCIITSAARDAVITQITSRIIIATKCNNCVIASADFIAIHIYIRSCSDTVIACGASYDTII